ncbi:DNA primase [Dinoroseobacter shibae DFL 12 = DSM 16493]|jgi:DNA primase|uniref:DNA primase n=2 Tax=Pseudomonadota TaxID=1224 RepID=A8LR75_DINSH|nr:DNA primase [Dinoroseobacter shibae]ABV93998.1 DNA primase [Dinoroseobacter shibae DFL 12 = DSM 16493]URF45442.1 DNA primase [Dinoroseobacter shibae]URF49747.1 DNA primase [Dinoroseobacter shibae]
MSLPPGFLDELRSRVSMAQVAGRKLIWDMRKSQQGKGDMWAPCPFHQEKTASFHVDDRKGYYYCFGCHAKGDAISFVRETENVGFMEAVEILAAEAGMPMPARDPQAAAKADRRTQLSEVAEQAVQFFRLNLKTAAAAEARAYLVRRGLSEEAQARWEIGFAPDGWQHLWDHLRGKGVAEDLILDAGLAKPSRKEGGRPYDVFRNRIMFPIRDARGRAIAFGGRAMDPEDGAKYLNSPETELFDKSRVLFNHARAREAAGKSSPLIVAEGYMDVIALSEAGFAGAVAPLGTAVTEPQLELLWRISPEPVFALDGDRAGLQAGQRVVDLALPLITAGKSMRFCILPEKQDPDDVIRAGGAEAMATLLDQAKPMVELLWQRETAGKVFDSPERKAALGKALRQAVAKITDPTIKQHYGQEVKTRLDALFGYGPSKGRSGPAGPWRKRGQEGPTQTTRSSALVTADRDDLLQESVILATLCAHPGLIAEFESDLLDHRFGTEAFARMAARLASMMPDPDAPEISLEGTSCAQTLEAILSERHVTISPSLRPGCDPEVARMTVAEGFAKLAARTGWQREMEDAIEDFASVADEDLTWRLGQAAEAREAAGRISQTDTTEYDIADNGARISRDERNALDNLLNGISFAKGRSNGG